MTNFNINVIVNPTAAIAGTQAVRGALVKTEVAAGRLSKVLKSVFLFAGVGLGISQLKKFADSFLELQNRLRVAGFETDQLSGATARLIEISNRTRSPLDANARLLGRIGIAAQDLGATQEELFKFVELTGKGLAIQGSSAQEARGALTQLSQALGSGIVRAEEFNSISEGAVPILQAVAAAMGTTVSGLRKLVTEGKVTSSQFFRALLDGGAQLDELFKNVAPTIGQALTVLNNQLIALVGTLETNFGGALSGVASIILVFANSLTTIVPLFLDFAGAIIAVKLAVFAQGLINAASSASAFGGGLRGVLKTLPGVTVAIRLMNAALLINPFILIATAIGLAIVLILQFGDAISFTADGTVTLATVVGVLIGWLGQLGGGILGFVIDLFGILAAIIGKIVAALPILRDDFLKTFGILGPTLTIAIAGLALMAAAFLGLTAPITITITFIALIVSGLIEFQAQILAIFPSLEGFFAVMNEALEFAVALWNDLTDAVSKSATELGLFDGNIKKTTGSFNNAAAAAKGAGDAFVSAGEKANNAFIKARDGISSSMSSAASSGSASLNSLADSGVSSAKRVESAWKAAAAAASQSESASSSAGSGGGGGGDGGGRSTSKTASITLGSSSREIAAAVGGTAKLVLTGGAGGKFAVDIVVEGVGFVKENIAQLTKSAIQATGKANAVSANPEVKAAIDALAKVQSDLKIAENLRDLSDKAKAFLDKIKFAGAGINSRQNRPQPINTLIEREIELKKALDLLLRPPADKLEVAAVSLTKAATSLTVAADAPIWLTENPFLAFRQNVFGFAHGGSFEVGGSGGADSKLMNLALTPGERVDIKTPAQQRREDDKETKTVVTQNIVFNVETPDVDGFRRTQTQILGKTLNALADVERRL